jgi:hypothetical protein
MGVFVARVFIFSPLCLQRTEKLQPIVEHFCSELGNRIQPRRKLKRTVDNGGIVKVEERKGFGFRENQWWPLEIRPILRFAQVHDHDKSDRN